MLRTEHQALACGGINKHWIISWFSQLQLPEQCWAPGSAQWAPLFPAPAAGQCEQSCSKLRFARDACVHTASQRAMLQLAQGVQTNFHQNESKSWLLQHFTFNKQANMPSLSAGTSAALGKQWAVYTRTYWGVPKGTAWICGDSKGQTVSTWILLYKLPHHSAALRIKTFP